MKDLLRSAGPRPPRRRSLNSPGPVLAIVLAALTLVATLRAQDPGSPPVPEPSKARSRKPEGPPRPGIPVTDPLVTQLCSQCHKTDEKGLTSRLSYLRKSPEGWEISVKRMVRLHEVVLTPEQARQIVRYLANEHGLTREEAALGLYEAERRVHASEAGADKDLRATCAACHSLGRVFSEQRDETEWKLLKATHLAFFPLADFQAFQGDNRGEGEEPIDFANLSDAEISEAFERRRQAAKARGDRADKVLQQLAKSQPLISESWSRWTVDRREVPLAGTWAIRGHETGRGDLAGTLRITRTGADEYATEWSIRRGDGSIEERRGKGLLYAGYSWRGRSTGDAEPKELREVLLLSEDWHRMEGRLFWGDYHELGLDLKLIRLDGACTLVAATPGDLMIPSTGNRIELRGDAFPEDLGPADFVLGRGVTVRKAERLDAGLVRLEVDVDASAERGRRRVSFRSVLGPDDIVLYDTIDYVRIAPERGIARVGGAKLPPQFERFELWAMNRGADDKLRTADDYAVRVLPATWGIEELPVREGDDDAAFVGTIDAATGLFRPSPDGPNPLRLHQANNVGEVYVTATCELEVREIPAKSDPVRDPEDWGKPPAPAAPAAGATDPATPATNPPANEPAAGAPAAAENAAPAEAAPPANEAKTETDGPAPASGEKPVVMVRKTFKARGYLLVTVPLFARWDRIDWNER